MIKFLKTNSILISILLVIVLVLNIFLLTKLNILGEQIKHINATIDCPHSSTDVIYIYYIQEETQQTNEEDVITNLEMEQEDEPSDTNFNYSEEEINKICRVVEAETHGADTESKIHIVHVILNRVSSPSFPNSIIEVCDQSGQFASRSDVEQSTIDAVYIALSMPDTTQGALFFHSGDWTNTFNNANYIFTDNIGHHFYK